MEKIKIIIGFKIQLSLKASKLTLFFSAFLNYKINILIVENKKNEEKIFSRSPLESKPVFTISLKM